MDQRKQAAVIKASDSTRKSALRKFRSQMKRWELVMPSHDPLVSDFGLDDFYKIGLIEYWIANEIEAGYCAKFLFVFGKQTCPLHWHKGKHETFFIVRGKVLISLGGDQRELLPGDSLAVPSMTPHSFIGLEPSLLLEVSQPCVVKDNIFHDPHIPIGRNYRSHLRKTQRRSSKARD
jgi:mannose-6-phosphate isomerase-like protein (cupin superfamily)